MTNNRNSFKRLLHWGPITIFVLTIIVTWTTCLWWPADFTLNGHFELYLMLNFLAAFNFAKASIIGPCLLEKKFQPIHNGAIIFLQYCQKCEGYKAPRSHHCRRCNRCIKKMDHHCPWINHCVGWANHAYFVYFLFFYMLSNMHAVALIFWGTMKFILGILHQLHIGRYRSVQQILRPYFLRILLCAGGFGLAIGITITVIKLLVFQIKGILKNMTDIEQWIVQKASNRRYKLKLSESFVYPYNLGWYINIGQVFNTKSIKRGKGIEWPVREDCDQYTLTREQLAQKNDKRYRTRTYKCIRKVTGYWLPIWSQGLLVTICIPCTDDPRIALELNDLIMVTRLRDHWLYGERVITSLEFTATQKRLAETKGWFPRCCAIEVTKSLSLKNS